MEAQLPAVEAASNNADFLKVLLKTNTGRDDECSPIEGTTFVPFE